MATEQAKILKASKKIVRLARALDLENALLETADYVAYCSEKGTEAVILHQLDKVIEGIRLAKRAIKKGKNIYVLEDNGQATLWIARDEYDLERRLLGIAREELRVQKPKAS